MPSYKELAIARLTFAQMITKLLKYAWYNNYHIVPASCWRSRVEQARLVKIGASKTQNSRHCYALAMDFVLFDVANNYKEVGDSKDKRWQQLGDYWGLLGGKWGGSWGWDAGHFEYWPFDE